MFLFNNLFLISQSQPLKWNGHTLISVPPLFSQAGHDDPDLTVVHFLIPKCCSYLMEFLFYYKMLILFSRILLSPSKTLWIHWLRSSIVFPQGKKAYLLRSWQLSYHHNVYFIFSTKKLVTKYKPDGGLFFQKITRNIDKHAVMSLRTEKYFTSMMCLQKFTLWRPYYLLLHLWVVLCL